MTVRPLTLEEEAEFWQQMKKAAIQVRDQVGTTHNHNAWRDIQEQIYDIADIQISLDEQIVRTMVDYDQLVF